MGGARVLVVDDEADLLRSLKLQLTEYGFDVRTATDSAAGLVGLHDFRPTVVVLDFKLTGENGLQVYRAMRKNDRYIPIILLSGQAEQDDTDTLVQEGVDFILEKGGGAKTLPMLIAKLAGQADEVIAAIERWVEANPEDADLPFFTLEDGRQMARREALSEMKHGSPLGRELVAQYRIGVSALLAGREEERAERKQAAKPRAHAGRPGPKRKGGTK